MVGGVQKKFLGVLGKDSVGHRFFLNKGRPALLLIFSHSFSFLKQKGELSPLALPSPQPRGRAATLRAHTLRRHPRRGVTRHRDTNPSLSSHLDLPYRPSLSSHFALPALNLEGRLILTDFLEFILKTIIYPFEKIAACNPLLHSKLCSVKFSDSARQMLSFLRNGVGFKKKTMHFSEGKALGNRSHLHYYGEEYRKI